MSGNLLSSGGPTSLCGFTISVPEVPLGGAGVVPMSVCCGAAVSFSQGPSPSLFLSCRPENWLRGQPGRGMLTCLLGWLPLASVSFWTVPWLVAHLSKLWEAALYGPPSLLWGSRLLGGGSPHHGPWLLAAQCNPTTSAADPGQQGWMEGCVVNLLHHQAW